LSLSKVLLSYTNNWKRLSVPCYFLAPCDKRKHTVRAHQQAASQVSTDSTWRHPLWLPHSSLGFQRPVGRRSYRLMPQATIAQSGIVAYYYYYYYYILSFMKLDYIFKLAVNRFKICWRACYKIYKLLFILSFAVLEH